MESNLITNYEMIHSLSQTGLLNIHFNINITPSILYRWHDADLINHIF
jgi:hypothetical protein